MNKVFNTFPVEGGKYITDHSSFLYPLAHYDYPIKPKPYDEFIIREWHFKQLFLKERERENPEYPFKPFYSDYLVVYDVSIHNYKKWEWKSKTNIILTLEHDNIANHIYDLDGVVVSERCANLIETITYRKPKNIEIGYLWNNKYSDFTRSILYVSKKKQMGYCWYYCIWEGTT